MQISSSWVSSVKLNCSCLSVILVVFCIIRNPVLSFDTTPASIRLVICFWVCWTKFLMKMIATLVCVRKLKWKRGIGDGGVWERRTELLPGWNMWPTVVCQSIELLYQFCHLTYQAVRLNAWAHLVLAQGLQVYGAQPARGNIYGGCAVRAQGPPMLFRRPRYQVDSALISHSQGTAHTTGAHVSSHSLTTFFSLSRMSNVLCLLFFGG